ncbi:phospholipase A2 inhibitor and Ly6/PLAUR domain-containing protein-like [Lissotriton helveticus]
MKALLASLSILFTCISRGESLICQNCVIRYIETCSEKNICVKSRNKLCFGGTFCGTRCETSYLENYEKGLTASVNTMRCALEEECGNFLLSLSIGSFQLRLQKNYCDEDSCNAEDLTAPSRDRTPNGVRCPLCYAEGTSTCQAAGTMECTGLETKCMDFGGKIRRNDRILTIASMNCVSEDPCSQPIMHCSDGLIVEVEHFRCSDGQKQGHANVSGAAMGFSSPDKYFLLTLLTLLSMHT